MEFHVGRAELEKALECLKEAEERGFTASLAVFGLKELSGPLHRTFAEESDFKAQLILKADPEDPKKNWGRISQNMIHWYRVVNGECVDE